MTTPSTELASRVTTWIGMIEISYRRKAWHGKNLTSTIKGVDAATAHRLPPGKTKSVWQVVLHCAYWCYRVRMRISGDAGRSFPRKGTDWLPQPETADPVQWQADIAMMVHEYDQLLDFLHAVAAGDAQFALDDEETESLVVGAAFHAIYHASQIMQFRRLLEAEDGAG